MFFTVSQVIPWFLFTWFTWSELSLCCNWDQLIGPNGDRHPDQEERGEFLIISSAQEELWKLE